MTDSRLPSTVLVIDDNEVTRYTLTKTLASKGVSVLAAGTAQEGIEMASQNPDLVLLDIHLPDMSGYQALEFLRRNGDTAHLPVIFMSATEPAPSARSAAAALGVKSFLTLPVAPQDLWVVIEGTFHRSKQ
jgi:two-component system alkaline phosphatase synthesis response regulator PhoP